MDIDRHAFEREEAMRRRRETQAAVAELRAAIARSRETRALIRERQMQLALSKRPIVAGPESECASVPSRRVQKRNAGI
jgi:hypothetical protein